MSENFQAENEISMSSYFMNNSPTPISDRGRDRRAAVPGQEDLDGVGRDGGDRGCQADGGGAADHAVGAGTRQEPHRRRHHRHRRQGERPPLKGE